MKRVHLIISGDVVGVGFRAWARRQMKTFGVVGWVENREDNTVELMAEGKESALKKLITACKRGPDVAWVEHVEATWVSP